MAWTKNDPKKTNLLRLSMIFLVVFIDKVASNPQQPPNGVCKKAGTIIINDVWDLAVANCEAKRFAHQLSLRKYHWFLYL